MELGSWHRSRSSRLTVAPSRLYAMSRVAQTLGEPEELLHELAMEMQPEDGCVTVLGVGGMATTAFTPDGLEHLREFLIEYRKQPPRRAACRL